MSVGEIGIAVIGMAGRFPGASSVREFWANLRNGKESIRFFTIDELVAAGVERSLCADPRYVPAKGFLDDVELFDASFFGYTPREAQIIDPQQRLFLECAWTAIEDAGYGAPSREFPVGVFAGVSANTYQLSKAFEKAAQSMGALELRIGSDKDFLATRVSYKLDLKGPSLVIQTACSTSLVAVCEACKSLLSYECDMALAGGVSISVPRVAGSLYQQGGIASPDGHCRPFDFDSNGTVSGEGVGIVVLKRLADALDDGDTIHAVIRGWAVNNDGSVKVGYTAPSVDGQAEVIASAQGLANVDPGEVSYIEAHGTATKLGDPIEVAALAQVFGARSGEHATCAIGSVKSNVGHMDAAAGIGGLIKTVLALEHREIPATLHFKEPNPTIELDRTPFYVNAELRPWRDCPLPRRAGVSSFGIGGTNAHVVLEESPASDPGSPSRGYQLLLLSAKTALALDAATRDLAGALRSEGDRALSDVAYTLALGRRRFSNRRAIVCRDHEHALSILQGSGGTGLPSVHSEASARPVAFLFPGQGAQYPRMGLALYETESVFREEIDRCARFLEIDLGCDLREILYAPGAADVAAERLTRTEFAQPSLFTVEYALARLWMSWGVRPDAMIGHSIGEYVAACVAGVFSLEQALKLVAARARIMQSAPAGAMLSVGLPPERLSRTLDGRLSIAAVNEPSSCVVSGPFGAVDLLETKLEKQGVTCRRLHTSHAFHSAMMEPIMDAFAREMEGVMLNPPGVPFISNVTGTWIKAEEATDPSYWVAHLRRTVRFGDGIAALLSDQPRILLEVGPGNGLTALAGRRTAPGIEHVSIASMRHVRDATPDPEVLLGALAKLWLNGADVDWRGYYGSERRHRVPLPTYPFERQRHWIGGTDADAVRTSKRSVPSQRLPFDKWFSVPSWTRVPHPSAGPASLDTLRSETWLVVADRCAVAEQMVNQLRALGTRVIEVSIGDEFAARDKGRFVMSPSSAEHHEELVRSLSRGAVFPDRIIHFLSVSGSSTSDPQALLDRCFYSPMWLAQAVGRFDVNARSSWLLVSDAMLEVTGDERIRPEKSTLLGPCRAIPAEYPNIACRIVDLPPNVNGEAQVHSLANGLIHEAIVEDQRSVIAYRGKHRWAHGLEPLVLDRADRLPNPLRDGGVYLVTGGLGGIGLALARGIASEVRARLVLLGRTALPPREDWNGLPASANDLVGRRIAAVRDLEELAESVMLVTADVTDLSEMRQAVEAIRARYGEINGVIHAAGIAGGGTIHLKTRARASDVLAPKVQGTDVLVHALGGAKLDFLAFCSSLASLMNIPGQIDYTAANAFLDASAQQLRQDFGMPAVSINWDTWRGAGMAVEAVLPGALEAARSARLETAIDAAEGVKAFLRILRSGESRVVVSTQVLGGRDPLQSNALVMPDARAESEAEQPGVSGARHDGALGDGGPIPPRECTPEEYVDAERRASLHSRPALATAYAAPQSEREQRITEVWEALFGIADIGIHDNFFELGGHSLLAIQLLSRLATEVGCELTLDQFFEAPTIVGIDASIRERPREEDHPDRLVAALDVVDQLSDEEVLQLLDENRKRAP